MTAKYVSFSWTIYATFSSVQSLSHVQLSDTMDCSVPSFPVLHYLPVCSNSCPLIHWCHPTISSSVASFFSCPQSFPASGSFPVNWLFASGGQSTGASASASVLPMNSQDWFPLWWTGWISFQSEGLSRVFSKSKVQKHQFFGAQHLHSPALTPVNDHWETIALTMDLCQQSDASAF